MNSITGKSALPRFCEALRIVVLNQSSSAAAERVFSELNFTRRAVGDQIIEDQVELRSFFRCNNNQEEYYTVNG